MRGLGNRIRSLGGRVRSAGGGAAPFVPSDLFANSEEGEWWPIHLLTAELYQDAARSTAATANNDPVGSLTGVVHGYHLSQGTAGARPLLKTDADGNGNRGLLFDTTDDFLSRADACGIATGSARTLAVLCALGESSARGAILMQTSASGFDGHVGLDPNTFNTAGGKYGIYVHNHSLDSDGDSDTDWHSHILTTDLSSGTPSTEIDYRIDGGSRLGLSVTSGSNTWGTITAVGATLLGNWDTIFSEKRIIDTLIIDRILTTAEQDHLGAYWANLGLGGITYEAAV